MQSKVRLLRFTFSEGFTLNEGDLLHIEFTDTLGIKRVWVQPRLPDIEGDKVDGKSIDRWRDDGGA